MDLQVFTAKRMAAFTTAFLLVTTPLHAEIYKWTDANGKVHFSDKVPTQHQEKAQSINISTKRLSDADVKEAEDRAARIQNAVQITAEENRSRAPKPKRRLNRGGGAHSLSVGSVSRPTNSSQRPETYAEAMQEYEASRFCYERHKNLNGTLNPAAHRNCTNISRPRESDY